MTDKQNKRVPGYYVHEAGGHMAVFKARDLRNAKTVSLRRSLAYGHVEGHVRPATQDDVAWYRMMGGMG